MRLRARNIADSPVHFRRTHGVADGVSSKLPSAIIRPKPVFTSKQAWIRLQLAAYRSHPFACVPLKPDYYRGAV